MTKPQRNKNPSFKELQKQWEQKLKEEGLGLVKKCYNPYQDGTVSHDPVTIEAKTEYFRQMEHNSLSTKFRDPVSQTILTMASSGAKILEIKSALAKQGAPRDRRTIALIIRRWEHKWGIRKWSQKELFRPKTKKKS